MLFEIVLLDDLDKERVLFDTANWIEAKNEWARLSKIYFGLDSAWRDDVTIFGGYYANVKTGDCIICR